MSSSIEFSNRQNKDASTWVQQRHPILNSKPLLRTYFYSILMKGDTTRTSASAPIRSAPNYAPTYSDRLLLIPQQIKEYQFRRLQTARSKTFHFCSLTTQFNCPSGQSSGALFRPPVPFVRFPVAHGHSFIRPLHRFHQFLSPVRHHGVVPAVSKIGHPR